MNKKSIAPSAEQGTGSGLAGRRGFLRQGFFATTLGAVGSGLVGCGGSHAATDPTGPLPRVRFRTNQDPTKIWLRSAVPVELLDTPDIQAEVEKARVLAADDDYLLNIQRLQCNDFDDTYTIVQTPGSNTGGAAAGTSGRKERAAEPTKVFDNVYYVGGYEVGGWVIDTGDGYIMLDSSYDYGYEEILLPNMRKMGLDPNKVKYILITHAGPDHLGATRKFQDNHGSKIIYSAPIAANPAWLPVAPVTTLVKDGDTLTLGNTTITIVSTPRTVGGTGLSYFIPVTLNGMQHLWATYGNTGIVGTVADKALYSSAIRNFIDNYVVRLKPDIAISSHPFVDGSGTRMEIIRKSDPGMPNPFVIGTEATKTYFEIMAQAVKVQSMRQSAGLNASGTARL